VATALRSCQPANDASLVPKPLLLGDSGWRTGSFRPGGADMNRDSLARRQFSRPGPQRAEQIGEIRPPGIIRLGEAAPILQRLRARMRARELYSRP
jgi:hypothetical protein